MRIVVILLLLAMVITGSVQYIDIAFAQDEITNYTVKFETDGNASVKSDKVSTDTFVLPEITVNSGYEFSYAVADEEVAKQEAGYKFSESEFLALKGTDFGQDTTIKLNFILTDNDTQKSIGVVKDAEYDGIEGGALRTMSAPEPDKVPTVLNNEYDKLPANYVCIDQSLRVEEAEVVNTMPGVELVYGYPGRNSVSKQYFYSYHGTVKYGKSNRTSKANAVTQRNEIPGKLVLTWKDKAILSDETKADVRLTVEDVYCNIGQKKSTKISNSDKVFLPIVGNASSGRIQLLLNTPRTSIDTNSASSEFVTGATCQTRRKATFEILRNGEPLDAAKYPYMLMGFQDLDVQDHSIASGKGRTAVYNGTYAEGVTLLDGWFSPVVLAAKSSSNKAMQSTVNTRMIDGHLNIKGDGAKFTELEKATGLTEDYNTYYGGFVAASVPAKTSFYWYGSNGTGGNCTCTVIGSHPTVAVKGKRTTCDAAGNVLEEDGGSLVRLDDGKTFDDVSMNGEFKNKTYVMNSSVQYKYEAKEGYRVKSLKLDGEEVPVDESGLYTFEKLNKNPLPERDPKTGAVLAASASSSYSIEVVYEKIAMPEFVVKKTANKDKVKVGDKGKIQFTIEVSQSCNGAAQGEYEGTDNLAEGALKVAEDSISTEVTGSGVGTAQLDNGGLHINYKTDEGETGKLKVTYEATIDWDKFSKIRNASTHETLTEKDSLRGVITNCIDDAHWSIDTYSNLELTKTISGDLCDKTKQFEFIVNLAGLEPGKSYGVSVNECSELEGDNASEIVADNYGKAEALIKMRGGGKAVIEGIPFGTEYKIIEEVSDHVASFEIAGSGDAPVYTSQKKSNSANFTRLATEMERVDAGDGDVTIAYTNTKNSAVISGVPDMFKPYMAGAGGMAILLAGLAMMAMV